MIVVAMAATLCVGFTSCKDKDNPEEIDYSNSILGRWYNRITEGSYDERYYFEFRGDGNYSYMDIDVNISGNYRITEIQETTLNIGDDVMNTRLFKILASGSSDFDQLWVYRVNSSGIGSGQMVVHLYSKNELVQTLNIFSKNP